MKTFDFIIDYFAAQAKASIKNAADRQSSSLALRKSYSELKQISTQKTLSQQEQQIYGVTRLAGTLSAIQEVFRHWPIFHLRHPKTIIDCGSGPGTALFASLLHFDSAQSIVAIEKDPGFIAIAQKAIDDLFIDRREIISFQRGVIPHLSLNEKFDLSILSYVLSETPQNEINTVVKWLINHTNDYVAIIDAGTPKAYQQLMLARDALIKSGWEIIAPCPHQKPCPMVRPDFCHFSVRFQRHKEAIRLKLATAQLENEKYCYVLAQAPHRQVILRDFAGRIVKKPMQRSGHRVLDLCTVFGELKRIIVSKKDKDNYRMAKDRDWGDIY